MTPVKTRRRIDKGEALSNGLAVPYQVGRDPDFLQVPARASAMSLL
jgi:hypothetical protein